MPLLQFHNGERRRLKMSRPRKGLFIVVLLAVFLGLSGCEQKGSAEKAGEKVDQAAEKVGDKIEDAKEAISNQAEKAGEYLDDTTITAKIKADILGDPLLKMFDINVVTTNGVVTLNGVVDSQQSIDRATEIAQSVKEVKSVENNLVVKGS
jgi:hyperosmotically inducible protein